MTSSYYPEYMTQNDIEQFQMEIENWLVDLEDSLHDVNMELTTLIGE